MLNHKSMLIVLLIAGIVLFFSACSHEAADQFTAQPDAQMSRSTAILTNVGIYMNITSAATGTVTVQIRNSAGTVVYRSLTVPVSSLSPGNSGWRYFSIPSLTVTEYERYTIYLKRSDAHTFSNAVYWMTSTIDYNAYIQGTNSLAAIVTLDFAFKTYNSGVLDQAQTEVGYGYYVANNSYRWQEFMVSY